MTPRARAGRTTPSSRGSSNAGLQACESRFSMRFLIFLLPLVPFAQHHPAPAEKPVALYKGLGAWRHPITTSNADAQKYFDQGLALLYGFNRYEALRSFRKAAELDGAATMAYWGM